MAPIDDKEDDKKKEEAEVEDPPIVKELKAIDDKYLELEKEYEKEVNELVKKFTAKQKPFLDERRTILTKSEGEGEVGTPALKGFWLKAMMHHPAFEDMIQKWDEPVLEYLVDIEKSNLEDDPNKGFKLVFFFSENPYFTNTELWKEYYTEETNPYNGDLDTKKIVVNEIDWKAGKNVTVERVQKKVKGGGAKKQKQKNKEKEEARPSFFRNFHRHLEPDMKLSEDMFEEARTLYEGDEEENEDDEQILEMLMDNDYQVGCALRDNIIPFAVRWYTGEAAPDQDDDDYDEEDEEEDDEDEEDSEEDEPPAKSKGKAAKAAAKKKTTPKTSPGLAPADAPKQEECKQQ